MYEILFFIINTNLFELNPATIWKTVDTVNNPEIMIIQRIGYFMQ